MADGRSRHPLVRVILAIFVLGIIVLIAQLWMNPPDRRAKVACMPAYRLVMLFRVQIPSLLIPSANGFLTDGIQQSTNFYFSCTADVQKYFHLPNPSAK